MRQATQRTIGHRAHAVIQTETPRSGKSRNIRPAEPHSTK